MFDPDALTPRINRGMVYLGACLIADIRLARESYRDHIEDAPMPVACPTRPSDLGILADFSILTEQCSNSYWPYSTHKSRPEEKLSLPSNADHYLCSLRRDSFPCCRFAISYLLLRHILSHECGKVEE